MNIAIIGTGAREHAIAWKLSLNKAATLFNFGPTHNPGLAKLCQAVGSGDVTDVAAVVAWCQQQKIDIAWIGPEAPLAVGVVDALETVGIACIGPIQQLAQLESSKSFTRELVARHGIHASPLFQVFTSIDGIDEFIQSLHDDVVIKPDGLTAGKGVRVMGAQMHTKQDALDYCAELFAQGDKRVVVEEKLVGQEFSLMSFSDGKTLVHMPAVQDHKRALVGDLGPNTGGMGSYTAADHSMPFLVAEDIAAARLINEQTIQAIQQESGKPYKGVIYGGFIAVCEGVRLIEYNARFGDPEVMNMLSVLETDLVDITTAIVAGTLDQLDVKFNQWASVCKYVVPQGYPDAPVKDQLIDVSQVDQSKAHLFYGAVDQTEQGLILKGSRAIGVVATGATITEAEQVVEAEIKKITGPVFHREDIGTPSLIASRVNMLKEIRHA